MVRVNHDIVFSTAEPAFAVDRNGIIVAWNDAMAESLGYSANEVLGSECWTLLQGHDSSGNRYCYEHCPMREMAARHLSPYRCRMSMKAAGGAMKHYNVSTLVLFDNGGSETLIHLCQPVSGAAAIMSARRADAGHTSNHPQGVLTPREIQVVSLLADGYTTLEIATLMSISTYTVRNHVEHVLHKLHAHSRLEAVAVARRLGMISRRRSLDEAGVPRIPGRAEPGAD